MYASELTFDVDLTSYLSQTPGYSNKIFQTNSSLPSQPLLHPIRPQTSADAPPIRPESHGDWLPIPLRNWFAIPLIVLTGVGAVAVELLWYYNKQAGGPLVGWISNP